jgi:hypothetical protein
MDPKSAVCPTCLQPCLFFSISYRIVDCTTCTRADLRWVISDKFWTASGVTAGIDMASAFLRYLIELQVGKEKAKEVGDSILGVTEVL